MPPGPALASALAAVDVRRLSGYDRVVVLRAQARMRNHYDAATCDSMVAVCEATGEELAGVPLLGGEVEEAASAEIGAPSTSPAPPRRTGSGWRWRSQGGATADNLAPACPKHHAFRHRAGWSYAPFGDADYVWTTALGHRYTTSGRSP